MPPRIRVWNTLRALPTRPKPSSPWKQPSFAVLLRSITEQSLDKSSPHEQSSDLRPFPQHPGPDPANALQHASQKATSIESASSEALGELEPAMESLDLADPEDVGHKFGLPALPIPSNMHVKHRYDPILVQLTRLLMRDGKLSKAQREMGMILNYLRTSPPPKLNPARPLLPGAPPSTHLPLNPVLYLTLAIDSVAPLIKIKHYRNIAGGGALFEIPVPLEQRQRRRAAFMWILDVVNKKKSRGSGRTQLAHRVAEEIVAVVEGRSSVWDKRQLVHRQGTGARANMNHPKLRQR